MSWSGGSTRPATPASRGSTRSIYRTHVIVVCNEGYASSLAAADLQRLGFRRVTDLAGGFEAWLEAGLPVSASSDPPAGS